MTKRMLGLLLAVAGALQPQPQEGREERIKRLESRLLAPCCWSEPISEHRSEVSLQMREEVRRMVGAGKTDREILDFYKDKYGMRVLIEPEGDLWWLMNVVPAAALALVLAAGVFILRRWRRPAFVDPL